MQTFVVNSEIPDSAVNFTKDGLIVWRLATFTFFILLRFEGM